MGEAWLSTILVCNLIRPLPIIHPRCKTLLRGNGEGWPLCVYMDQLKVPDSKKPGPGLQATLPIISWDV